MNRRQARESFPAWRFAQQASARDAIRRCSTSRALPPHLQSQASQTGRQRLLFTELSLTLAGARGSSPAAGGDASHSFWTLFLAAHAFRPIVLPTLGILS